MNPQDKELEKDRIEKISIIEKAIIEYSKESGINIHQLRSYKTDARFYKILNKALEQAKQEERNEVIKEVEKMIDDFIKYSNEEKKDNYLWYKFNLNNLKTKLQELKK